MLSQWTAGNEKPSAAQTMKDINDYASQSRQSQQSEQETQESVDDDGNEERTPLIYTESNKNRVGWLMPDESIPK